MSIVPLKSAALGRWRLAIGPAVARLRFRIDLTASEPNLVGEARDVEQSTEIESIIIDALIEMNKALAPNAPGRLAGPNAAIAVAITFRDRPLDLLSEASPPLGSRRGALVAINAAHAYAEALGAVIKTIIESDGPAAVGALAEQRQQGGAARLPPSV